MNSPKAGARSALRKRLRDTLGLLVLMLVTAFILLLYQGTISLKGVRGAFTPPLPRMKPFKDAPDGDLINGIPAAAPLQAPMQQVGSSRWVQAFTGFMPPFKSWMPPKMMAKAAAWSDSLLGGDVSAASKEQLSTLKYSFPDALPKVALLFLTRLGIPYEAAWKAFLESVPDFGGQGSNSWMLLFNVYVHPPPNVVLHESSIFRNYQLPLRAHVEWGQWSVVEAEKLLLAQALSDPLNSRFVLLSETCVPLYPAPLVWAQLQGETRSRLNACANVSDPNDESWRMTYRWNDGMASANLTKEHWRKSGQWFTLHRKHVQVILDDTEVAEAFQKHCWVDSEAIANGWGPKSFCPSDEHYIPTLLASKGLDNETDCTGATTAVWWDGPYMHPKEFSTEEIDIALIDRLRGYNPDAEWSCDAPGALQASAILLPAVRRTLQEMDSFQEGLGLGRRRRHSTGGRSLKDVGHGLPGLPEEEGGAEEGAARDAVLEAEIGRVLLQWGQSGDGLHEALLQTLEKKEKGAEVQPNVLPSWAVPAIEGVPEAIQAAAQATTKAVKDAKDAVQSAVTAVTSPFPEKEHKDPDEMTKRMAEFLTLAEAVRGLKGKAPSVVISHVGSPLPTGSPTPAPDAAVDVKADRRDYWSGNPDNSLLEAMLAAYSPLGSASCPLFARKFREEDALTFLSVAEGYLQPPEALDLQRANH